ncbi:hypothetical protein CTEN210_08833 [Chaetoceros tenuissimus]|uniref:MYND-type domain-containing protein n=1 Tax=Chaetoceros tenuissimus TaxID=426638 RepID=A0AAD3CUL3_9STRA|nr:hypothetical protein CTEN210_08833 [Chaetoceros tenuissimus]
MSSSESIVKPTGLCAACQKEGATKRCRGCLDVGMDVFFCNRECQVKLWKTHKILCGNKAAPIFKNANSKKKVDKALRKFLKESNQSIRVCCNCRKKEKDVKLDSCSACDGAAYCSRECQKAHWPEHKEICKHNSTMRQQMDRTLTPSEKNIYDLLEQWRSNPTSVQVTLHAKCQQLMDISECPPTKVMLVSLEFDYNAKTFVFAEEPSVIPICQSPQNCQVLIMKHALSTASSHSPFAFMQYAFVSCKDLGTKYQSLNLMHFGEDHLNTPKENLLQTEEIYKYLPLKSDLFDGWDEIRKSNLKKQFDYLNNSNTFTGFLSNALQLFHNKIRLSVCGIVVYVQLGKELGQITNFIKYEDMPKSEFKKLMKDASVNDIREIPPNLLHKPPVMAVVLYKDIETNAELGVEGQMCILNKLGKGSVKKRKKDADHSFKQLQSFFEKMPSHIIEKVTL